MSSTDFELINKTQAGDQLAFEELVYRHDSKVYGILSRFTKNSDDAKDLYQEVFIRVYKGLKNFKQNSEFSTWLYRITVNVCLSEKRKMKNKTFLSIDQNSDDQTANSNLNLVDENNPSPFHKTSSNQIGVEIKTAVEKLSPKQRITFILKHYEGYKIKEIAEMLECNEGTIKKYLFDATRNLRKKLGHVYN